MIHIQIPCFTCNSNHHFYLSFLKYFRLHVALQKLVYADIFRIVKKILKIYQHNITLNVNNRIRTYSNYYCTSKNSSNSCKKKQKYMEENTMSGTNNSGSNTNQMAVPHAKEAMNRFKQEVASELGVPLKEGYNGDLTSAQAGSIGGEMVKKMIMRQEEQMSSGQ